MEEYLTVAESRRSTEEKKMRPPQRVLHPTNLIGDPEELPTVQQTPDPFVSDGFVSRAQLRHVLRNRNRDRTAPYPQVFRPRRFTWTAVRHQKFVDAVDSLGGLDVATPSSILAIMKPEEWSIRGVDVLRHWSRLRQIRKMLGEVEGVPNFSQFELSFPGRSGTYGSIIDVFEGMKLVSKDN